MATETDSINDKSMNNNMNEQLMVEIRGAVARGWCSDNNKNKVMDVDLVESISIELLKLVEKYGMTHPSVFKKYNEFVIKDDPVRELPRIQKASKEDLEKLQRLVLEHTEVNPVLIEQEPIRYARWGLPDALYVSKFEEYEFKANARDSKGRHLFFYGNPIIYNDDDKTPAECRAEWEESLKKYKDSLQPIGELSPEAARYAEKSMKIIMDDPGYQSGKIEWDEVLRERISKESEQPKQETWRDRQIKDPIF